MNSILIIFFLKIYICSKIISFPLKLKFQKYNYLAYSSYNSTNFLNDNYKKELIVEMNIGTPAKKINVFLNPDSYCFEFKSSSLNSSTNYYPHKSTSFNIDKIQSFLNNNVPRYISSNDIFNFSKNETFKLSFVTLEKLNISTNKNISLIPEIGLNNLRTFMGYNFFSCNNFINGLKNIKAIKNRIFSIKYNNKYDANFILGDDLHQYDPNHYNKEHYFTKYYVYDFGFYYDNIYAKYPWNKTEYLNITGNNKMKEAIINLNSGFIIGTEDFKNFIYKIFFKYLIEKKICSLDLVDYNETDKKFGKEFYIYSCNHMQFTGQANQRHQTINYYSEFPNIKINSKSFEYDFEITKKELFEQIYTRDYFLIIFPKNRLDNKNNDTWYLGEPFYKKYPFTVNLDAKTIGFYLDKKNINTELNVTKGIIKKNNNGFSNDNSKIKNILIRIGEILIGIIFIITAYYIGKKVKEGRKIRANELKDDCYEYISEDKKDINKNEQKNKQLVELNSKLGI